MLSHPSSSSKRRRRPSWLTRLRLDPRSLALMRISLGLIAMVNAAVRLTAPEFLPAATGVMPRSAAGVHEPMAWSFHFISESLLVQQALLVLYGIVALCLLVGYRTRLSTLALWILTVSLEGSNGLINNTGDHQLALMLLWGCFLPLGERWSLDTLLSPATATAFASGQSSPAEHHRQPSIRLAECGFIIQIAMLYWLAASHKDVIGWLVDADAVWYAFNIDFFAHPLATHAQKAPALLQLFSRSAYLIQWIAPMLVLLPLRSQLPRLLGSGLLIMMHIGFLPFLKLGLFPWISIASLLALLPSCIWSTRLKADGQAEACPTIFFDQDCRFCRDASVIVRRFLCLPAAAIVPAQSDRAIETVMSASRSWVIQEPNGALHTEFNAFIALSSRSPWARHFTALLRHIQPVGRRLYRVVADHRAQAWKVLVRLRGSEHNTQRVAPPWAAALMLALAIASALQARWADTSKEFRRATQPAGDLFKALGLRQRWKVFAPMPLRNDGWFELQIAAADGSWQRLLVPTLQPWSGQVYPFRQQELYRTQRHRKFFTNLRGTSNQAASQAYLAYLCRQFQAHGPARATALPPPLELTLVYMQENSNPPTQPPDAAVPMVKATLTCDA
jgi:predicted DCC family thiol-disulfide oxidoreductase YuxK